MDTINKKAFWATTIILIVILILGVAGTWYYLNSKCDSDSDCDEQEAATSSTETQYKRYRYELEIINNGQDQMLRQVDKETMQKPVIVDSIKDKVLDIGNNLLYLFADPQDSDLVFFNSYLPDTDSPGSVIYSFNPESLKFTKMAINEIYDGFFGGMTKFLDEKSFVYVPNSDSENGDDKKLYLMDLINDTSDEIVTLEDDETLNAGMGGMTSCFGMSWVSATKVKYAVFDQSKKSELETCPDVAENIDFFIEYRTFEIK